MRSVHLYYLAGRMAEENIKKKKMKEENKRSDHHTYIFEAQE